MRFVVVLAMLGGVAHADPVTLDARPAADAVLDACVRDGKADQVECKVLATRTIAGQRIRVIKEIEGTDEEAYVELATAQGAVYARDTTMHYSPGMGERSSPVQTVRDWSRAPVIDAGTLADGKPAAIVRIPWTSHDTDRATGTSLAPIEAHAVIMVCALGDAPACSTKLDVDCPISGCTATLAQGVLSMTTREQRQVTR